MNEDTFAQLREWRMADKHQRLENMNEDAFAQLRKWHTADKHQ